MKKLFLILVFVQLFVCCSRESNKLNEIIKEYESERGYEFNRNESVENTIKYHQADSGNSQNISEKGKNVLDLFNKIVVEAVFPKLNENQILVKISYSGVCGSQLMEIGINLN